MAACEATKEVVWLQKFLMDLQVVLAASHFIDDFIQ